MIMFGNQKLKAMIKSIVMNCIQELQNSYLNICSIQLQQYHITVEQFVNYIEVVNVINNQFQDLSNISQEVTLWHYLWMNTYQNLRQTQIKICRRQSISQLTSQQN
ncbi:unnamed protein product [Paramecium sonneborni]|uniref:Uncharacterized protein n=1 Tax=Paramecium sonneborni TaxID=65129 RepID=A0A8S1MM21_9CILI|nr:unnamed protein product [Paramecium sonneborni]